MNGDPDAAVRARQARVRQMIEAGQSVVPDAYVPAEQSHNTAMASHNDISQHHASRSPSHSRRGSPPPGAIPIDTGGLRFQKEAVGSAPGADTGSPAASGVGSGVRSMQASTLAQQLQLARSGLDDSNFPRSASMAIHKYTVFLPMEEEGSMVQIATMANCTAHELVKEALRACIEELGGGELPVGMLADPWAYRVYVAEEDGEVDTDFPSLDPRVNVASLGVESFVLRDRVDAAKPTEGGGGRPASGSNAQEGTGEDHSSNNKAGGGFASLETEGEVEDQARRKEEMEAQKTCCKCVVQ